jgi:hypothetical protein
MAPRKPHEDPMTRTKSKRKIAARPRKVKTTKPKSLKRRAGIAAVSAAVCTENLIHVDDVMESPKLTE